MRLEEALDLGDAPDALRTALFGLARIGLFEEQATTLDEDGHLSAPDIFFSQNYEEAQRSAGAWRRVRDVLDEWREACPPENRSVFDTLADNTLPREGERHYDAFHAIQGDGKEYAAISRLYLISKCGLALEYADMMLDGVTFERDGRVRSSQAPNTEDLWGF
jgi:hypothetical protein